MKIQFRTLASICIASVLLGCATTGRKVDQSAVAKIQTNASTKDDVRRLLGDPLNVTKTSAGTETWAYHYTRATAKGQSFIPIVGAFAGGVNTQIQSTVVTFNESGVVTDVMTSFGADGLNTGVSAGSGAKMQGVAKP